jgi:hypothetical protein
MNWWRSGWPLSFQYWRASLSAVSTASEPPEEKNTLFIFSGANMRISRADSSMAGGLEVF